MTDEGKELLDKTIDADLKDLINIDPEDEESIKLKTELLKDIQDQQKLSFEYDKQKLEREKLVYQQTLDKNKADEEAKKQEKEEKTAKKERIFKWVSFGVTTAMGAVQFIGCFIQWSSNMKLIYKDDGKSTPELKDTMKFTRDIIFKK